MTLIELLNEAEEKLTKAGVESARLDAEVLLAHAMERDRVDIYMNRSMAPAEDIEELFRSYVERRAAGCPVAYIKGFREFWSMPIKVTGDVLIPRPETELVVEVALKILRSRGTVLGDAEKPRILDLGTGSGCIAAALASEISEASFVLTDISKEALEIAKQNLSFAGGRVEYIQSDLFNSLPCPQTSADSVGLNSNTFDLIVTNPPYIPTGHRGMLGREITEHEPDVALFGGKSGLDFAARIIEDAPRFMKPQGALVMEMGLGQSEKLEAMVREFGGYSKIDIARDLAGIERVITLWKS